MELQKKEIFLRPITDDDTAQVLRWRNSDGVKQFFLYRKDITPEEHRQWLREKVETGLVYQFIIVVKSSHTPIGSVYIQHVDRIHRSAEFGIFIGEPSALGRGFGTTAAELMAEFAFSVLGLDKLYLRVLSDNSRAIKSYQSVGFSEEPHMSEEVCIDGVCRHVTRMSMIHGA